MPDSTRNSKAIVTLEEFLDNVIYNAFERLEFNTRDFMSQLHARVLKGMREKGDKKVALAYFEMYALLNQEKTSRSRIISTAEGVVEWLKTH